MNLLDYQTARSAIRNADILLVSGAHPLSRAIRWFTKSEYNHVGLLFWVEARMMFYEAAGHGTRQIPLSEYLKIKGNACFLARHPNVTPAVMSAIHGAALDLMAVPYDYPHLFQSAWRIVKGRFGWKGDAPKNKPLICSEFVRDSYQAGEIRLADDPRGFITPDNIAQQVDVMGRLT